jgi:hypothetical protein
VLARQRLGTPDRPDAAAGNRGDPGWGLEPGAQAGRWAHEDEPGHPRRRLDRTLALSTLLEVVLVQAIGIDAPPLAWIWLIIYFAIDLVVFASIAVTATDSKHERQAVRSVSVSSVWTSSQSRSHLRGPASERLTSPLTVRADLGKGRSAQRWAVLLARRCSP